jgi:pterin-4a-carbinolamine dehydratase
MCDPLRTARPVAWSTVESFQYIAVDRDGGPVVPCWQLRNFQAALDMFSRVAALAEAEGHHPDLHLTGYNNVAIELSTHSVGEAAHPAAWASKVARLTSRGLATCTQLLGHALGGHARQSQKPHFCSAVCGTVSVLPCTPLLKLIQRWMEVCGPHKLTEVTSAVQVGSRSTTSSWQPRSTTSTSQT